MKIHTILSLSVIALVAGLSTDVMALDQQTSRFRIICTNPVDFKINPDMGCGSQIIYDPESDTSAVFVSYCEGENLEFYDTTGQKVEPTSCTITNLSVR